MAVSALRDGAAFDAALAAGAFAFLEKSAQLVSGDVLADALTTLRERFDKVLSGDDIVAPIVVPAGQLPLDE